MNLSTDTSSITASSNSFSIGTVCWYKFTPDVSSIKSIKVDLMSLQNANAEVYVETSTNEYNYKGTIGSGYSVNATIDAHDSVWVLITPLASNAYASIITYASPYSNEESSSSLSTSTIIVIVASSIGCWCCCIIVIWLTIGCSLIKLRKWEKRGKPEWECKDIEIPVPMINNYQIQNRPQSNNHSTKSQSSSVEYEIPVNLKMEQNGINNYPKLVLFANDSVPSNSIQTDKEKKVSDSKA